MSQQHDPNPAEFYEQYLGPTISDPWTQVLLECLVATFRH